MQGANLERGELEQGMEDVQEMSAAAQALKEQVLTDILNAEGELKESIARRYAEDLGTTHEALLNAAEGREDELDAAIWERAAEGQ